MNHDSQAAYKASSKRARSVAVTLAAFVALMLAVGIDRLADHYQRGQQVADAAAPPQVRV